MSISDHPEVEEFVSFIHELADAAGTFLSERHEGSRFETKPDASPVTEFDRGVETRLREMIRERYPEHGIVGEEFPPHNEDAEFVWIMDPIDGTKSFVVGIPIYTTLIALCHNGVPVIGVINAPSSKDRFLGVQGRPTTLNEVPIRTSGRTELEGATGAVSNPTKVIDSQRAGWADLEDRTAWWIYGAAAYGYGRLAAGGVDIAVESGTVGPYDINCLVPIIEGAGGKVTDGFGGPVLLTTGGTCVASATQELHEQVLAVLNSGV